VGKCQADKNSAEKEKDEVTKEHDFVLAHVINVSVTRFQHFDVEKRKQKHAQLI
jgi:hypothetical protein